MQVKTFQANDMPEALRMVKAEFGPNAMILTSRKKTKKGFLGLSSTPYVEVTAAPDFAPPAPAPAPKVAPKPAPPQQQPEMTTKDAFQASMIGPLARELKELRERVETLQRQQGAQPQGAAPAAAPADMGDLRRMIEAIQRKKGEEGSSPAENFLREQGVDGEALEILMKGLPAVSGETNEALTARLKERIRNSVKCAGPVRIKKNVPQIMALVGPTGVGKTTTIAKLAALAYKQGAKVALITIDTFRIGAVDQLKAYSSIMQVPLEVASTPQELSAAIAKHGDKQLIFIDTTGRSPRDADHLAELKRFLAVNPSIEIHLCLSASTRDREVAETVKRFGVLPVSRMLFTKLDESETFGSIVNVHLRDRFPLSYFTTGQRVPEDIEPATATRVADLIAGGNC